jgi:hypothetical protein
MPDAHDARRLPLCDLHAVDETKRPDPSLAVERGADALSLR